MCEECWTGTFPAVQRLRHHTATAGGMDSTPGWGRKIPHATWWGQKIILKKKSHNQITNGTHKQIKWQNWNKQSEDRPTELRQTLTQDDTKHQAAGDNELDSNPREFKICYQEQTEATPGSYAKQLWWNQKPVKTVLADVNKPRPEWDELRLETLPPGFGHI